jgi:hypothetical protein
MNHFPTFNNADNLGGNQGFSFIPADLVLNIPPTNGGYLDDDPELAEGASFFNGYATAKTLLFDEKEQKSNAGTSYLQKIIGFYPKIIPSVVSLFTQMRNRKFIVKITDSNGLLRLVGTIEQPLEFRFSLSTGNAPVNRNGISFEFYSENEHPAPFLR